MLKSFLYIFLLLNFASVQSLAAICKTKCSILEAPKAEKKEQSKQHQNCHSTKKSADNKGTESECGSICQTDDLISSDAEIFSFSDSASKILDFSNTVEIYFLNHELSFAINTHDPPGYGFYSSTPVFIQKSSFLI